MRTSARCCSSFDLNLSSKMYHTEEEENVGESPAGRRPWSDPLPTHLYIATYAVLPASSSESSVHNSNMPNDLPLISSSYLCSQLVWVYCRCNVQESSPSFESTTGACPSVYQTYIPTKSIPNDLRTCIIAASCLTNSSKMTTLSNTSLNVTLRRVRRASSCSSAYRHG